MFAFIRRLLYTLNLLLALYSLLAFQLSYSAEVSHWLGGFIMLSIPFVFVFHLLFVLYWLFIKPVRALLSLLVLAIAFPLSKRIYGFEKETVVEVSNKKTFSVLSYNVMYCDYGNYFAGQKENSIKMTHVIDTLQADIKCFQELYNNNDHEDFRVIRKLKKNTKYYTYMHATPSNDEGQGGIGLAIFSKFPIVDKKEIYWKLNNNGILQADIKIKKDTVRVINVQLQSMGIRINRVLEAKKDEELVKKEAKTIVTQLKNGFEQRSVQVKALERMIERSPYPVILCGDFNEIPYGYAYGRVRKQLTNAFETSGTGFGFTYNKAPRYIRIDNQFYSDKKVSNTAFKTFNAIPFSDHYPIWASYLLK